MSEERMCFVFSDNPPALEIGFNDETLVLDLDGLGNDVIQRLMLEGLKSYLQRRTYRSKSEDKVGEMENVYHELMDRGLESFGSRGRAQKGSKPHRQSRIAAIAMLKGTTPAAVRKRLEGMSKEAADMLLNHPKVVAKAQELQDAEDDLELD